MLSEILGKKIWKEVIRESMALASQMLEVSTLRELAGPQSRPHLLMSLAED